MLPFLVSIIREFNINFNNIRLFHLIIIFLYFMIQLILIPFLNILHFDYFRHFSSSLSIN